MHGSTAGSICIAMRTPLPASIIIPRLLSYAIFSPHLSTPRTPLIRRGSRKGRTPLGARIFPPPPPDRGGPVARWRSRRRVSSVSDLSSRLGPSQPGELGGGAKARHRRLASLTLTASQGNAAKPGGRARAVRASARRPSWNSTVESPRSDTRCRVSQRLARMDACATPLSNETSTMKRRQRNDL